MKETVEDVKEESEGSEQEGMEQTGNVGWMDITENVTGLTHLEPVGYGSEPWHLYHPTGFMSPRTFFAYVNAGLCV